MLSNIEHFFTLWATFEQYFTFRENFEQQKVSDYRIRFVTVAHMCKTPPKKLLHPRGHKAPQYPNQIATVNLKHPPKDSKHPQKIRNTPKRFETPPKDSKHPQMIRNTPKRFETPPKDSKHPQKIRNPHKIRNAPKDTKHPKRFETPQKIRNNPKDSKPVKIHLLNGMHIPVN